MTKKNYIYIEPYVYSVIKDNLILLYNTISGKYILEKIFDNDLLEFLTKLLKDNAQRIIEDSEIYQTSSIITFIDKSQNLYLIDYYYGDSPFLRPFDHKVMHDINLLKNLNSLPKISSLIQQLNIVLGKTSLCKNKELVNKGLNQFLFPSNFNEENSEIDADALISAFSEINLSLKQVSFVGDYYKYREFSKIESIFKNLHKTYYSYYLDFNKDFFYNNRDNSSSVFVYLFDSNIDKVKTDEILFTVNEKKLNSCFMFIISSEDEYHEYKKLKVVIDNKVESKVIPFFNGDNYNFFEKNIFLHERSEILDQNIISEETIFSNKSINSNFFGELYIMSNNKIYTNPNSKELGNLNDKWDFLLKDRLLNDPFWFRIRDKNPCKECVCQFICPPLTNYEIVMQKENFCTLK